LYELGGWEGDVKIGWGEDEKEMYEGRSVSVRCL